jgi:hypothetical protein
LHPETDPIHNITTIVEKKTKKKATPSPIAGEGVAFFLVFFLAYATLIHMKLILLLTLLTDLQGIHVKVPAKK